MGENETTEVLEEFPVIPETILADEPPKVLVEILGKEELAIGIRLLIKIAGEPMPYVLLPNDQHGLAPAIRDLCESLGENIPTIDVVAALQALEG